MPTIQGKKTNGKTISSRVYKMKGRHNHSKLFEGTINDICEYLKINISMSV